MRQKKPRTPTDADIRQWILADESLYLEAREFGRGNDEAMYRALPRFIKQNRERLRAYIMGRLEGVTNG